MPLHKDLTGTDLHAPGAHKTQHQSGGSDAIKLDDLDTPDDNTDLNATSGHHGLLKKLSGSSSDVLRGDGTWGAAPIASGAIGATELASTAVTPGSYTSADITVDADGRITAAANGTGGGGGGALVLLEQHTASSSASLDFTASISSTYDDYLIKFIDIVPASDNVNLLMRMSTNGGSSYDSGNNYLWCLTYGVAAGVGGAGNDTTAVSAISVGGITNVSNFTFCGSMELFNPGNSTYKTVTGQFRHRFSSGDARRIGTTLHGSYEVTTAVNAFQFLMSSGNIASGTIRVYGVAK